MYIIYIYIHMYIFTSHEQMSTCMYASIAETCALDGENLARPQIVTRLCSWDELRFRNLGLETQKRLWASSIGLGRKISCSGLAVDLLNPAGTDRMRI